MESDRDKRHSTVTAQQQLDIAERAGVAPFVDYAPTPRAYPPAVGLWSAGMVAAVANLSEHRAVALPVLLVLIATEFGFLAWYRRYRGTTPNLASAPPELRSEMTRFVICAVAALVAVVLATMLIGWVAGSIVAFVVVTVGLTTYERRYAAAAELTRRRLS